MTRTLEYVRPIPQRVRQLGVGGRGRGHTESVAAIRRNSQEISARWDNAVGSAAVGSAAVASALIGLAGVVVGAFVTGWVTFVLERRRHKDQVFLAKRLLSEELDTLWVHLGLLVETRIAPQPMAPDMLAEYMPTAAWGEQKEILAARGVLTDDEWTSLSMLMHNSRSVRAVVLSLPAGAALPPSLLKTATEMHGMVRIVYAGLTGRDLRGAELPPARRRRILPSKRPR